MSAPPPGGVAGGAKANSGGKVVDVNLNNFRQVVESESAVIIMCTSARAAAAQALQATLTEEVMRSSSLILALVNVDRETEIAKQLQVRRKVFLLLVLLFFFFFSRNKEDNALESKEDNHQKSSLSALIEDSVAVRESCRQKSS